MADTSQKKVGTDLTQGSILQLLIVFALPIAMTNIIQQFYSLVDLMVIGQFVGSEGTAGVSAGGEIVDLVTPVATAFASAGQIYIAQLTGAGDVRKTRRSIGTFITMMMIMSFVFMTITLIFNRSVLTIINCPEEAFTQARSYMMITALGIPFIYGYNAICGVLRGMGESRRPMMFIIVAAIVNIFLDILLVAVFPLGVAGTAIATAMAEFGAFISAFLYMYRNREQFSFELRLSYFAIDSHAARIIIGQGIPQAIRSALVRVSMLWVNAGINSYGLIASATNGVGNKLQKFLDVFTQGLAEASSAMIGQNLGAKRQDRAAKTVWCTLECTLVVAVLLSCLSIFVPGQVFGIFTNDPEVIDLGVTYMHIQIAHFFCSAVVTAFQAMVIGSGFASMNFAIGILDGVVCKVGLSIIFADILGMGVLGYFWASGFSRALPAVICFVFFMSGAWKRRKLLTEK